jgi:acetyl-CoA decarbonylase/synthase complex subunit epsilon
MSTHEPWQTAEIPGPKKAALITKPDIAVAIIGRAKRPVIIAGSGIIRRESGGAPLIDAIVALAHRGRIPVIATSGIGGELAQRGLTPDAVMAAVDISQRLIDPQWKGLDGAGGYDLAIFAGLPYPLEWTILSGLKHFSLGLRTMALDGVYQPNASWSFPNLSPADREQTLKSIMDSIAETGEQGGAVHV